MAPYKDEPQPGYTPTPSNAAVAKGVLLEFESVAHHADGDPIPLLREMQNLGYEVYRREFVAACDYVMYVDASRRGLDSAEHFLEAAFDRLGQKPKKTEIMSLAPVFEELHRYPLYDDVVSALPAIAKGHRIAIVSSLPSFSVARALEPIKSHLTAVVTPREAKAVPPNPTAYRAALVAMKLRAKDVSLVSPHCSDLSVARPLGVRLVFISRQGEAPCSNAHATIRSFEELEPALRAPSKPTLVTLPSEAPTVPATPSSGK